MCANVCHVRVHISRYFLFLFVISANRNCLCNTVNVLKTKNKKRQSHCRLTALFFAEREGFEPPDPRRSTVFKTAAFDRSAIFPIDVE